MDEKDGRKASTGTYRLRGISRDLHRAARLRAASEGTTLRSVVLQALRAYSAGTWSPPDASAGARTNGI
jgi:predicted HicB family RNase H-like nuclease